MTAACVLFGGEATASKYALRGMSAAVLLATTLATACAVLWTLLLVRGHERPEELRRLALLGLLEPAALSRRAA